MLKGKVIAICMSEVVGENLRTVDTARAVEGRGLEGDRFCVGEVSFNKGVVGKRQVTLMNTMFFADTTFSYPDSRRNIFTEGVELMDLIGKEFLVGQVIFKGIKYCDPCMRPSKLSGNETSFREAFFDRGGLVGEIHSTGIISVGDAVTPPKKNY
jgi:hypothetical protein